MPENFSKDIDTSGFDDFDFGFELVDAPESHDSSSSDSVVATEFDSRLENIESQLGNVLSILSLNDSTDDLKRVIEEQGSTINTVVNEIENKKIELERDYARKIEEVENLVLPLLVNLTKNPEREYIKWTNRASAVQSQINKILKVTRGNGD